MKQVFLILLCAALGGIFSPLFAAIGDKVTYPSFSDGHFSGENITADDLRGRDGIGVDVACNRLDAQVNILESEMSSAEGKERKKDKKEKKGKRGSSSRMNGRDS